MTTTEAWVACPHCAQRMRFHTGASAEADRPDAPKEGHKSIGICWWCMELSVFVTRDDRSLELRAPTAEEAADLSANTDVQLALRAVRRAKITGVGPLQAARDARARDV